MAGTTRALDDRVMAIRFHFDHEKLSPREVQIIRAIIGSHVDSTTFLLRAASRPEAPKREVLESYAESTRKLMSHYFPDLELRWEWKDSPEDKE